MTWVERLVEVNDPGGNGKVVFAHIHPAGETSASFEKSKLGLILEEQERLTLDSGQLGYIPQLAGAGRLGDGRNEVVKGFLRTDAEWLLFVDSDMGFGPDLLDLLMSAADPQERPVVGGLAFASRFDSFTDGHGCAIQWQPTMYRRVELPDGQVSYEAGFDYPQDSVVRVDGTGAAVILIHRTILESIGGDWFTPFALGNNKSTAGEDIAFCERLHRAGIPIYVNTAAKTNHHKDVWYSEADYLDSRQPASSAVTVVIPVKDNLEMTRRLVGQLHAQGGYTDLLIFDNGSTDPEMVEWLSAQGVAEVFDAAGASIHEMWNAGIGEALARHRGLADVVFLNNDLSVGHRFLRGLVAGLRSQPGLMAACGNYDRRPGSGVSPLRGICANRYDGTGGLAGFAFVLRAEWIATGFRFDESMRWWYGDNDLCLEIEKAGGWYGMVHSASVVHLDGGSQTATPDDWAEIIAADRAAFEAKWPHVKLVAA